MTFSNPSNLSTTIKADRHYVICTDGAYRGNPGPGGWGLVKQLKDGSRLIRQAANADSADELPTTHNRMELMATTMALENIREIGTPAIIRTDSKYVLQGITEWLPGWKAKGWRSSGGAVKNVDLWQRLDAASVGKIILWEKVRGHSGDRLNEMGDLLAGNAARGLYAERAALKKRHPKLFVSGSRR